MRVCYMNFMYTEMRWDKMRWDESEKRTVCIRSHQVEINDDGHCCFNFLLLLLRLTTSCTSDYRFPSIRWSINRSKISRSTNKVHRTLNYVENGRFVIRFILAHCSRDTVSMLFFLSSDKMSLFIFFSVGFCPSSSSSSSVRFIRYAVFFVVNNRFWRFWLA